MNEHHPAEPTKVPGSPALQRIDAVCDRFEAEWLSGGQPDIARHLQSVSPPERPALLIELVQLDVDYRRRLGQHPVAADYEQHFPDSGEEIRQALRHDITGSNTGVDHSTQPIDPSASLPLSAADDSTRLNGKRFGDYELLDEIARGGMGVVYKARQIRANRIVALKMILTGGFAGNEEVQRFHAEAQAAASLDHPRIVPVYDAGEVDGQHYFSMGFVDGRSLADEVRDGPLEQRRAAEIMKTIAEAIAFAHGKRIVHRDLKPANILLDPDGNPRVTDFGLAKQVTGSSDLTATGQVLGTPSYMAPEQALGNISEVGPLSDVYSLGAVQYHLLTGRPPFRAASIMETLGQVVDQMPVAPRQLNPAIDLDLDTITLKALEKNPASRYASAQELADDLGRFLEHRPIVARRISTTGHVVRWARRNRLAAALLLLSALFMAATTTLSIVAAIQFQREGVRQRESAEKQRRLRQEAEAARQITTQNPSGSQRWIRTDFENEDFGAICHSRVLDSIAARSRAGRLFVLSPEDGSTEIVLPDQKAVEPASIGFSPNGRWLATVLNARPEGTVVKIRDTDRWESYAELVVPDGKVFAVAWSPDSTLLAVAGDEAKVHLIDAENRSLWYSYKYHDRRIIDLAWSPDSERLASCSEDFTIVINDFRNGLHTDRLRGHTDTVRSVDWSRDGSRLISVGGDDTLRVWHLSDSPPDERSNMQMTGTAYASDARLHWHPHDDVLAMSCDGAENAGVITWDVPRRTRTVAAPGIAPKWSPNGEYLAAVVDQSITITAADGSICQQAAFQRHENNFSLDWHPTELTLVLANHRSLFLWDLREPQPRLLRDDTGHLRAVAWSPSGDEIAIGTLGLYLEILDARTGNVLRRSPRIDNLYATDLAWNADGTRIAATALDRTDVMLWDASTLNDFVSLRGHTYGILHVAWSPDGSRLASSGRDETVRIWDTESHKLLLTFEYHAVDDIGWNHNGRRLAAIGRHGHLQIWDATAGYRAFSP